MIMSGIVYQAKKHIEELIAETKITRYRDDSFVKAYQEELVLIYDSLNKVLFCPDTLDEKSPKSINELKKEKEDIERIFNKFSFDSMEPREILVLVTNYVNVLRQIEQKCFICDFLH